MDRDSGAAVSGVGGARGVRTQTDRLTGAAQDAASEDAATLVGDRTVLTVEAELGRRRKKKIDWVDEGKRNICEDMTSSAHSEAMPSSAHYDQSRSLHNNIKCLSKKTFLKGSKSYILVSTF